MKKDSTVSKGSAQPNLQPLGERILVRPESSVEETSPSGIFIPDTARKEKPERGLVIAIGEGRRTDRGELLPMRVEVGDTVMFSKYGFDEVIIDDIEYYIVPESNILAIVNK